MYVQWAAQQQIDQLGSDGRRDGVSLHLDLPLGVGRDSFDMWRERDLFVTRANGGSPPDPIFTSGQNWGFAPMNPRRIREDGYRYYLEFLRFQMRQTGLLRIDHIMGLHRLYCIPRGFPASQGAYLRYPAEELYAILCLESHRHKTVLVGENLGTVPRAVNHAMTRHQFNQMYVAQYEQRPKSSQALRPPPKQSVASVNTHDMPSFTAHWRGSDLLDRARLGLIPKDKLPAEKKARRRANLALVKFLKQKRLLDKSKNPGARDVLTGCLRFLAASQARFVLVNLEDLWCETQPQNTPGTSTERPNWRRKARFSLEQIRTSKACLKILAEVDRIRAGAAKSRAAKNSRTV
jgi:4-alpha-glucanotransferase